MDALYAGQVQTAEGLPLRGATVWAPADLAAAQPRTVLTGAEGRFRIQMGAGPFRVLVVHPDYEPAYIEQAQTEIRVGPLRAARRVLTLHPGQTVRRYPLWLSLTLAAIPFLGALAVLFWNEQRRAKFASFEAELDLKPVTVHSRSEEDKLFERVDVAALARELRKRRPEPTGQLAAEATILRTAARAGLFTPVKLERKVGREYLVLVERKSGRDQQARFWACLLDRLAGRGVWLDRYFFAGDPRVCEAAGGERAWVGLPELAALHPRHELWVLAASERFFDSITREPAPWLKALARWPERAVVRLTTGSAEDEVQLRDLGFGVTAASVAGLAGLEDQQVAEEYLAPYPLALEDSEARWMPGAPPATEKEVRSLLRQLRAWLGGNGYRCLLACAVYPALAWNLTLHLALHLIPADREETLARLVRLPWFRHGRIPEWLRVALVRELKESEAKRVLELLRGFVAHKSTPAAGESGGLELVKPGAGTAAKRKRDYVYLSFLYGRKPDPRDLEAPGWLKRLLYPDGVPLFGLRKEALLTLGLAAAALVFLGAERFASVSTGPEWREMAAPPALAAPAGTTLSALAVEVAAAAAGQPANASFTDSVFARAGAFAGSGWVQVTTAARPGARFDSAASGPGIVEHVTAEGIVVVEPFDGRARRVLRKADGKFAEMRPAVIGDVYFDANRAEIREDARETLTTNAAVMLALLRTAPKAIFVIEGHTDEKGAMEYQLGLGERLASAAKDFLVQLGVPAAAMRTVSYGNERPVCRSATEACRQLNRRVRFTIDQNLEPMAGSGKVNPVDGLRYNWIPAGKFRMGCSPGDSECYPHEKPPVNVEISKGFRIGETEVTQAAYLRVRKADPSNFKGAQRPVEQVSWNDAKDYCAAIGGRLPTEAEWEYAARAGSVAARYGELDQVAWHDGNSKESTHDVRGKLPNAWGLFDMLGNVWEWTGTWYAEKLVGGQDPRGPSTGDEKVLRGGSWIDDARRSRASYRYRYGVAVRYVIIGFRCAWDSL